MDSNEEIAKGAPWLSFQTFWNYLEAITSKPMPRKLDRSMMSNKSGTDQSNLISAMQTFGLTDAEGHVQPALKAFQDADPDGRKKMLGEWVRALYVAPLRVSAENGTPQDLKNVFRDEMGMTAEVTRRKAITFFQHAAQHAEIALSPNFPKTRTGSGAPGTPKPKVKTARKAKPKADAAPDGDQQPPAPKGHTQTVKLKSGGTVTLTYDVNMFEIEDDDEAFVLDLIKKLRRYANATEKDSLDDSSNQGDDDE